MSDKTCKCGNKLHKRQGTRVCGLEAVDGHECYLCAIKRLQAERDAAKRGAAKPAGVDLRLWCPICGGEARQTRVGNAKCVRPKCAWIGSLQDANPAKVIEILCGHRRTLREQVDRLQSAVKASGSEPAPVQPERVGRLNVMLRTLRLVKRLAATGAADPGQALAKIEGEVAQALR